jgi:hypothetical protein
MSRNIKRTNYKVYEPGDYEARKKLERDEAKMNEENMKKQNNQQNQNQNNFFKNNNHNNNDPFKDFDKIFSQPFFKNNMNANTNTQTQSNNNNGIPGMPDLNEIFKNIPFFNNNMGGQGNMNFTTSSTTNGVPNNMNFNPEMSSNTSNLRNRRNRRWNKD